MKYVMVKHTYSSDGGQILSLYSPVKPGVFARAWLLAYRLLPTLIIVSEQAWGEYYLRPTLFLSLDELVAGKASARVGRDYRLTSRHALTVLKKERGVETLVFLKPRKMKVEEILINLMLFSMSGVLAVSALMVVWK